MKENALISFDTHLGVGLLLRQFSWRIAVTWLIVLVENLLLALLPLFIGRAIDALLVHQSGAFWELGLVMGGLIVISVGRRIYDTRAYGTMRVWFGGELVRRLSERPVSSVNARLDMGREMVDFLEEYIPELMTAVVQVVVSIVILWNFNIKLGISALCVTASMGIIYAAFHRRFYRLNSLLNAQRERQVSILELRNNHFLGGHLKRLRQNEVRLSDADAFLYGAIFAAMFAFILVNLWFAALMTAVTAGTIFAVISYSWELVESGVTLPTVLQQWTRLSEISDRINETQEPATPV